jgi:hypothetical protein
VTTITSTGHSLGGGLATISAFGAADLLKQMWDSEEWTKQRTDKASPWQTQVSGMTPAPHKHSVPHWAAQWHLCQQK